MVNTAPINIIENFISPQTCKYLIESYKNSFFENENTNDNVLAGPSLGLDQAWTVGPTNTFPYTDKKDKDKTISSDIFTHVLQSMKYYVSKETGYEVDLRTVFLSKMVAGAKLQEHYDNYDPDGTPFHPYGTNSDVLNKIGFKSDFSALLYLNEDYDGGEIEFTQYDLKLKPKPGTFIFFKGDMNARHLVHEVKSGERINLVTFFWESEYRKKYFEELSKQN
jgi:hypothetical protein